MTFSMLSMGRNIFTKNFIYFFCKKKVTLVWLRTTYAPGDILTVYMMGGGRERGEVQQSFIVWTPKKYMRQKFFLPKTACMKISYLQKYKTTTPLYTDVFNQIDISNAWFCITKLINFIYLLMSLHFLSCSRGPLVKSVTLPLHHFMLVTQA